MCGHCDRWHTYAPSYFPDVAEEKDPKVEASLDYIVSLSGTLKNLVNYQIGSESVSGSSESRLGNLSFKKILKETDS